MGNSSFNLFPCFVYWLFDFAGRRAVTREHQSNLDCSRASLRTQCSTNCRTGGQLQGARQSDPEGAGLHGKVSHTHSDPTPKLSEVCMHACCAHF